MMRKLWIKNTPEDRIAILQQAERAHTGVTLFAVEKDWWVTATLYALSRCACAPYLSFKGGTSLSKGFGLIERFSEDIDIALQHSFFGIEPLTEVSGTSCVKSLVHIFIIHCPGSWMMS